ncbi:MAG: type II toxin-antitoxin system RelB/DinJ family antitoxin [Oscillospiraceae bacterium]
MATTSVTMRVDCEDKAKAEQIFNALGLNMSTAFNMFIKQTIRCDGIPFEVTLHNTELTIISTALRIWLTSTVLSLSSMQERFPGTNLSR